MPDPIRHVVVLMFENRSFDEMLGAFASVYPGLDGVDPANPGSNRDSQGRVYRQIESFEPVVDPDPKHELENIDRQLHNGGAGFVLDYETSYETSEPTRPEQRQRIMSYFPLDTLPALHALAREFTICDHWYSSVPGPTWTNRFFVHSGTSLGIVETPEGPGGAWQFFHYTQDTLFDRLNDQDIEWRVYHGDVPQSLVLVNQRWPWNAHRYDLMSTFYKAAARDAEHFPQYAFIEPCYMRGEENDDHPPHNTLQAQRLLADVYNALRANENLWNSTLLVVTYDEHGGFYDHVPPPAAVPPDGHHEQFAFDRFGVRVPALLISPWVDRGVVHTPFDHTSIIRYVTDKWGLEPLTRRSREANSIGSAIRTTGEPRTDTPPQVEVPAAMFEAAPAIDSATPCAANAPADSARNDHQQALLDFTRYLEQQTPLPAAPMAAAEDFAAPALSDSELARRRVQAFKAQRALESPEDE